MKKTAKSCLFLCCPLGLNLDFPDPESGVLPVTPSGIKKLFTKIQNLEFTVKFKIWSFKGILL